jgi:hypothetical protein
LEAGTQRNVGQCTTRLHNAGQHNAGLHYAGQSDIE